MSAKISGSKQSSQGILPACLESMKAESCTERLTALSWAAVSYCSNCQSCAALRPRARRGSRRNVGRAVMLDSSYLAGPCDSCGRANWLACSVQDLVMHILARMPRCNVSVTVHGLRVQVRAQSACILGLLARGWSSERCGLTETPACKPSPTLR